MDGVSGVSVFWPLFCNTVASSRSSLPCLAVGLWLMVTVTCRDKFLIRRFACPCLVLSSPFLPSPVPLCRNHGTSIPPQGLAMLRLYPLEPWHAGGCYSDLESAADKDTKK